MATLFFRGVYGPGTRLVVTDGTTAGTRPLVTPDEPYGEGLNPVDIIAYQNEAYFVSFSEGGLWRSDGTVAGTVRVLDAGGTPVATPEELAASGNDLFLLVRDPSGLTTSLWVSHAGGPPAPIATGLRQPYGLVAYRGGGVLFYANDSLIVSYGTTVSTGPLFAAGTGPGENYAFSGPPVPPVMVGRKLVVSGFGSDPYSAQLFVTDGTGAGARQIIVPGTGVYGPQTSFAVAWGDKVVFDGALASGPTNLFAYDTRTGQLANLSAVLAPAFRLDAQRPTVFLGRLLLNGHDPAGAAVLLLSDGTAAGTTTLASGTADASFYPADAKVTGGVVYLPATLARDYVLLRSDGTTAGTAQVPLSTSPTQPVTVARPTDFASLGPAATLFGDLRGRSLIEGTGEDNAIVAYGSSNTIYGNPVTFRDLGYGPEPTFAKVSSNVITGSPGGYDAIAVGNREIPPGLVPGYDSAQPGIESLTERITLSGRGNKVVGGQEQFTVTGGAGLASVTLANGDDDVELGGSYNDVVLGIGTSTVKLGGGNANVTVSGMRSGVTADDTIVLAGQHNAVFLIDSGGGHNALMGGSSRISGGTGFGTFTTYMNTTLVTDGAYNVVRANDFDLIASPGSGHDTVLLGADEGGHESSRATITLAGTHNKVSGLVLSAVISGGTGSNAYSFTNANHPILNADITITAGGLYNDFTLSDTDTNTIVAGSGYDHVLLGTPPFYPVADGMLRPTSVTFAGLGNSLVMGNQSAVAGPITVTGGGGYGTFILGDGTSTVTTGGEHNNISLELGTSTVDAGSGYDTITLDGTMVDATVHGAGNRMSFSQDSGGVVHDQSQGLHLDIDVLATDIDLKGIANDPTFVIRLIGGGTYYATPAAAAAAVTPDGSGGSHLQIGEGMISFEGLTSVRASSFQII